uniref:Alkylglycerol monooxygenase n=1 Tax=Saccoglossus kowalevskii TaxID=10224 RepID=A0ABM0LZT4_SACKO
VGPLCLLAILLEMTVGYMQGQDKLYRINDTLSSLGAAFLMTITNYLLKFLTLTTEFGIYQWVYEHLAILHLPVNLLWTWLFAFVCIDLGYYWCHRLFHEVNILWATHQVHHSSEDMNFSVSLRQGVLHIQLAWIFYIPFALFIPPTVALVTIQFTNLYQCWIHTEVIRTLGPLEFIICTPSHHRVHHGTFAEEKEQPVYGITTLVNSWNPIYIQFVHFRLMYTKFCNLSGWYDKLSVIWKGPGWYPGKRRCGIWEDYREISYPVYKYNMRHSLLADIYAVVHYMLIYLAVETIYSENGLSHREVMCVLCYIVLSVISIGAIFEKSSYAPSLECFRCILYLSCDALKSTSVPVLGIGQMLTNPWIIRVIFTISSIIWGLQGIKELCRRKTKN